MNHTPETTKRMEDVLIETVQIYWADPRGRRSMEYPGGRCMYRAPNGNRCGVGRCLDMRTYSPYWEGMGADELLTQGVGGKVPVFREGYEGLPVEFWAYVQHLHDDDRVWCDRSALGFRVRKMCSSLNLDTRRVMAALYKEVNDE